MDWFFNCPDMSRSDLREFKKTIEKLSTAESRVLITGQTGTGKELVARKIHKYSNRSKFPFIVLNASLLQEKKYEKALYNYYLYFPNFYFFYFIFKSRQK